MPGTALNYGFATVLAMWVTGFVLRKPTIDAPGWLAAATLLAIMAAGLVAAGRSARRRALSPAAVGAATGLVIGLVNLLILGSLLTQGDDPNDLRPNAALMVIGWLVFALLAGALLSTAGGTLPRRDPTALPPANWHGRFALLTALAAVPLVIAGGIVTSVDAGLAVPDWPNSYGANMFLFPLSRMTGGVYYEHAHRLLGSLLGLTTLVFLVFTLRVEKRLWVRLAVGGVFALVCVQGIMGGLRVTGSFTMSQDQTAPSLALAAVHGATGQLTLAALAALAAVCSARWKSDEPQRRAQRDGAPRLIAGVLLALLVVQLVLGVSVRHVPQDSAGWLHALLTHLTLSIVVFAAAIGCGFRARLSIPDDRLMRALGAAILHSAWLQMALGLGALVAIMLRPAGDGAWWLEALLATCHQANGAALLCLAVLAFVWSRRLVLPPAPRESARTAPAPAPARR